MMKDQRWYVWYITEEGLKRFCSDDMSWEDLPDDGFLAIKLFEERGSMFLSGYDYYFRFEEVDESYVYACDTSQREINILERIKRRYTNPIIKFGKWTSNDLFKEVQRQMKESD